jgi:hypothetical protein
MNKSQKSSERSSSLSSSLEEKRKKIPKEILELKKKLRLNDDEFK